MPPGGAPARADQLATLEGLAHRMFVTDEIGGLLAELEQDAGDWSYDSDIDDKDGELKMEVLEKNAKNRKKDSS